MSSTVLVISHTDPLDGLRSGAHRENLRAITNLLDAFAGGAKKASEVQVFANGDTPVAASNAIIISSGSGSIAAVINGVSVSTTWATSDSATATALAAAINSSTNALVQHLVTASASGGIVTIRAAQKGITGNCITLAATGTGATASGARLTGGAGGDAAVTTITL